MQRFQLRLRTLLWLVAIVAAFLGGVRYGEYRARPRHGTLKVSKVVLSPAEVAAMKVSTIKVEK